MSLPNQFMNEMISNQLNTQTREFFRPKSTLERLQLILSLSWFLIAFLGNIEIQAILFFTVIGLIVLNRLNLFKEDTRSFIGEMGRFSFYFFIFVILRNPSKESDLKLLNFIIPQIILVQTTILSGLIIIGILMRNVRIKLLKPTLSTDMFVNYLDFIFQNLNGLSSALFLLVFFELFGWVSPLASSGDLFPNYQDLVIIIASISALLSSQGPQGSDFKKLMVSELFLASETRFERARDSLFKISLIVLFFLNAKPLILERTLINNNDWSNFATTIFVIAIITFMLALFDQNPKRNNLGNLSNRISETTSTIFPEKFKAMRDSIEDSTVSPDITQYFKLNEDILIFNKEKTKFIAKKNSVAIPVKETPEGMAVVFVGENELTDSGSNSTSKYPTVQKVDESATAVIIPNDVWQSAYNKLEVIKPTDETIRKLGLKGIETKDKLVGLAESTLKDFKLMTLPKNFNSKVQLMVSDFQQGKYGISETEKGTNIRLPGITVIENSGYTFVRFLGIKVLEAGGSTVVSMPFIKVIDTPDYDFVNLPGIKVIDAGGSSLVNLGGFQITSGNQAEIELATKRIADDTEKLSLAFNQLDNHINSILESPDQLLLSKSISGKKMELLSGTTSDRALISGLDSVLHEKRRKEKRKAKKIERKERKKVKASATISVGTKISKSSSQTKQDNSIELLNKFFRIVKISQGDLDLERLSRQLGAFSSKNELEDWIINLNLEHLQVDWESNKLILTDDFKNELSKLVDNNN